MLQVEWENIRTAISTRKSEEIEDMMSLFDTIQNYKSKNQQEETGLKHAQLVNEEILSLETLTVNGHMKKGVWVPSHLHFNLTYMAEAEESEEVTAKEGENSAVQWWSFEGGIKGFIGTMDDREYIYKID